MLVYQRVRHMDLIIQIMMNKPSTNNEHDHDKKKTNMNQSK